jgi:tRNA A-37 threonylcarbamoyl transferase component Bud32
MGHEDSFAGSTSDIVRYVRFREGTLHPIGQQRRARRLDGSRAPAVTTCPDDRDMRPLPHGYTNRTVGDAVHVEKTYQGPDAQRPFECERSALTELRDMLPVPRVYAAGARVLSLEFLPGTHGQELIEQGHAEDVLRTCGLLLRRLHEATADGGAHVLVHGDFGPNNVLLDPRTFAATGLLDWEFAHRGDRVEDLAWCEWIVRTHHARECAALADFFAAYGGPVPAWGERRAAMVARCRELREFCRRWEGGEDGPAVRQWSRREAATAAWAE